MNIYRRMQPQAVVVLNRAGQIIEKLGPYTHTYELKNALAYQLHKYDDSTEYYVTATRWDLAESGAATKGARP